MLAACRAFLWPGAWKLGQEDKRNEVDFLHGLMFVTLFCPDHALVWELVGSKGINGDVVPFQRAGSSNSFVPFDREAISPYAG